MLEFHEKINDASKEAYKVLRSNIHFSLHDREVKTIAITSALPKEGKTSIAINLSIALASENKKVLLVDTDLRKPSHVKIKGEKIKKGLADFLSGECSIENILVPTSISGLNYISCGNKPSYPSEMLFSEEFDKAVKILKDRFDYIIYDTPSLQTVTDASILASKSDGTILIVRSGRSKYNQVDAAVEKLRKSNAFFLGFVLNGVDKKEHNEFYDYYRLFE